MGANAVCLQASGRNAGSSSRLKQTAELMRAGALCCCTAMRTLRSCWGKVKIHLKCSSGLGCVTAALGSVFDPDEILSLDPPRRWGLTSSCSLCNPASKERCLNSGADWSLYLLARSLIRVMEGWNCSLDIISVTQFPLSLLLWKGLSNGKHMEVFVETGNAAKTPFHVPVL